MRTSRSVLGLPKATKRKNNFLYVQYIFFSPSVISHQSQPGVSHRACSSLPASSLFKEVTRSHTRTAREKRRECLRLALLAIIGELARRLPPPPPSPFPQLLQDICIAGKQGVLCSASNETNALPPSLM